MLNSLLSFFNNIKPIDDMLELRKPYVKDVVYIDELISKKPFSRKQKVNGSCTCYENSEPLIKEELEDGKRGVLRVKVKMTKQEAARMLSKCKNGGILDFKDVACELMQIPTGRITVESSPASSLCVVGPVLKSIPEEF
ncbi:hypothetical protein C1H46_021095 [Malus baccata]|uniref:DUF7890 domain-containing protein n=1 Tax=Malus baccata TaxID=106549 RepID=A0A540M3F9_MALBA|nr:hypothetical protein C1H46_021095 [Malus baccata]